jgi:hypothetical protein
MQDSSSLTWIILGAIAIFIVGIIVRAVVSSENPPAWLSFVKSRKAQGKPTQWKEWKDDD